MTKPRSGTRDIARMLRRMKNDIRDLQADEARDGLLAVVRNTDETVTAADSAGVDQTGRPLIYDESRYDFTEY